MNLIIVVDIDGVITDLDWLKKKKKNKKAILDLNLQSLYKFFLIKRILAAGICFYSQRAKVRNEASEVIRDLINCGDDITIMTKRLLTNCDDNIGAKIKNLVELHLLEHDIPYHDICYTSGDKVEECLALEADVIIEDSPKNIKALAAAGIVVICFRTPYNENIIADNKTIFEARNWHEVYLRIEEIRKIKEKEYIKTNEENKIEGPNLCYKIH